MFDRAGVTEPGGKFLTGLYGAAELDSFSIALDPSAGRFHLKTSITNRAAIGFTIFNLRFVIFPATHHEIRNTSDEPRSSLIRLTATSASVRLLGRGFFHQTDAFFGDNGMCSVSPEEDHIFLFAINDLARVAA